jgi:hypothetical protein
MKEKEVKVEKNNKEKNIVLSLIKTEIEIKKKIKEKNQVDHTLQKILKNHIILITIENILQTHKIL